MKREVFDKIVRKTEYFLSKSWVDELQFKKEGVEISNIKKTLEVSLCEFKLKFGDEKRRGNYYFDRCCKDRIVEIVKFLIEQEEKRGL
mgnify:CR=1 FL=1